MTKTCKNCKYSSDSFVLCHKIEDQPSIMRADRVCSCYEHARQDPSCETCANWTPDPEFNGFGFCDREIRTGSAGLTDDHFGCILWEEKP